MAATIHVVGLAVRNAIHDIDGGGQELIRGGHFFKPMNAHRHLLDDTRALCCHAAVLCRVIRARILEQLEDTFELGVPVLEESGSDVSSSHFVHASAVDCTHGRFHISLDDAMQLPCLTRGDLKSSICLPPSSAVHRQPLLRSAETTRQPGTA